MIKVVIPLKSTKYMKLFIAAFLDITYAEYFFYLFIFVGMTNYKLHILFP